MTITTVTEWSNEFIKFPGSYSTPMTEAEARGLAGRYPEWRRLVKRTITRTEWTYPE